MRLFYARSLASPLGWGYRNPRFFRGPEAGVEQVALEDGYPEILDAYEAAGVPVIPLSEAVPDAPAPPPPPDVRGKVLIPDNWRHLSWAILRNMARELGATPTNRAEAMTAIEAELIRRQGRLVPPHGSGP